MLKINYFFLSLTSVLIIILALNLIFWVFVICWRIFIMKENRNTSLRYQRALRELLAIRSEREMSRRVSSECSDLSLLK